MVGRSYAKLNKKIELVVKEILEGVPLKVFLRQKIFISVMWGELIALF